MHEELTKRFEPCNKSQILTSKKNGSAFCHFLYVIDIKTLLK